MSDISTQATIGAQTAAPTQCPRCKTAWEPGAHFCDACGAPANWTPAAEAAPASGATASAGLATPVAATLAPAGTAAAGAAVSSAASGVATPAAGAASTASQPDESTLEPVAEATKPACPKCGSTEGADDAGFCLDCGAKMPQENDATAEHSRHSDGWRLGAASDIGRRHHENQDAFAIAAADFGFAIVVSDGVSSAQNSHLASRRGAKAALDRILASDVKADPRGEMAEAILDADDAVRCVPGSLSQAALGKAEPQATIVCARVIGRQAALGWVGDSRAYAIGRGKARLLTRDDSWMMDAIDKGMDRQAAMASKFAHAITQCLGMLDANVQPRSAAVGLEPGEELLLCSDGLWNYFEEPEQMFAAYREAQSRAGAQASAEAICEELTKMANERGGIDNVTVAVLRVAESEPKKAEPAPEPQPAVVGRRARIKRAGADEDVG
jgi:PPM family protein phosphatase